MTNLKDTGHGVSFRSVSGINVEYDERGDMLIVGPCTISTQFFEMLKKSAMAGETIKLGFDENFGIVFTSINNEH